MIPLTRRRSLLLAGSLLGSRTAAADTVPRALSHAARRAGLHVGSSADVSLSRQAEYAALIIRNCDLFTPNLSWQGLAPTRANPLANVDGNVAIALRAGLRLSGYHLLWYQRMPAWFASLGRPEAERAIVDHIKALGTSFGRNTYSWNVVNEAIQVDGSRSDGLRSTPLLSLMGTEFFDVAFNAARDAAPDVMRVYNEYNLELATPQHAARRDALFRLLDLLQGRGVPIQAVGLQSHLSTANFASFDPKLYRSFLASLASRGLNLLLTEVDVADTLVGDVGSRDSEVADIYQRFLSVALEEPKVRSVVFWGLSDQYSWLNDPNRPTFRRVDGTLSRPLPFDQALRPKPALNAVLQTFDTAPFRSIVDGP